MEIPKHKSASKLFCSDRVTVMRSWWLRYGLAVGTVIAGWGLREAFTPLWGPTALPFLFFYPAVVLSAWYGGIAPALVATIGSSVLAGFEFLEPGGAFASGAPATAKWIAVACFGVICLILAGAVEMMHRAREAASQSHQQIRNILESIDECFYALDPQGRFTYVNAQMERHLGQRREAMLGRVASELFPQVVDSELERQFRKALSEGVTVQFEILSPVTGRWLEVRAYPSSEGLSIFFRDITERKRAEQEACAARAQLACVNEGLERMVQERTAKLQATIGDLEQFSFSMAHDMRAPLRSMSSFGSILLEEHSDQLDDESLDYLNRIVSSAKRMDELIRDVLLYGAVGRGEMHLVPVNLDQLVHDIVQNYPNLQPYQASIEIISPLLTVTGHVALLTQCISNLLSNAVKFVGPGATPQVRIWTEQKDRWVRLFVRDNGIGIERSQWDRIWGMFERAHGQKSYPGTGIGLSVVKRAVERMGGSAGVESEPGQGSTFWLQLAKC